MFNRSCYITDTNGKSSGLVLRLRIFSMEHKTDVPLAPVNEFKNEGAIEMIFDKGIQPGLQGLKKDLEI